MTSNLGSAVFAEPSIDREKQKAAVLEDVRLAFRPEFVNRIDEIVVFDPLGRDEIRQIVDIQLRGLQRRLEGRKLTVTLTDGARDYLANTGYDPAFGARPLKRLIQREIQDPLAMKLLSGDDPRRRHRRDRRRARRRLGVRRTELAGFHPRRERSILVVMDIAFPLIFVGIIALVIAAAVEPVVPGEAEASRGVRTGRRAARDGVLAGGSVRICWRSRSRCSRRVTGAGSRTSLSGAYQAIDVKAFDYWYYDESTDSQGPHSQDVLPVQLRDPADRRRVFTAVDRERERAYSAGGRAHASATSSSSRRTSTARST